MSLKYKITLNILFVSLSILLSISYIYSHISRNNVIDNEKKKLLTDAHDINELINLQATGKLSNIMTIASAPVVFTELRKSNTKYSKMDEDYRSKLLDKSNKLWKNSKNLQSEFIKPFLNNDLSYFIQKQQSIFDDIYGEIFITNKYGALVASTSKLSSCKHADKYWWKKSYNEGKGKIFFDDRGFDASVGGYVVGIVVPIIENNNVIGILKANINIRATLKTIVDSYNQKNSAVLKIARTKGDVVYETGFTNLSTTINPLLLEKLQNKETGVEILKNFNKKVLSAYLPIIPTFHGQTIELGGKPETDENLKGNNEESWHVIIELDENIALLESQQTNRLIIIFGTIIITIVSFLAYMLGKWISGPIVKLERAQKKLLAKEQEIIQNTKASAKELERISSFLIDIINSVDGLIFVKDIDSNFIECNSAFASFMGKSKEDILGKNDYDFFDKEMADSFRSDDISVITAKSSKKYYEWVTFEDGSKIYLFTSKSPLYDSHGNVIGIVGNAIDMTKEKELEDKLQASQNQFELFMDNLPHAVTIKDEQKNIIYYNEKVKMQDQVSILVNHEVDKLLSKSKNLETTETILQKSINGQKYIARLLLFSIPQIDGKVYTGVIHANITDEFTQAEEIKRLKSALEKSPVSIIMTDINGTIEYVNPNYTKVTGYTKEELIGQNPRILKSGETPLEVYEKMWKHISSGNVWNSTVKNLRKDRSPFWEDTTIIPVFDEENKVDGYISFKLEVTDKVILKKELQEKEELIMLQSRHAAMGEMISMIAHQWRQPITIVAMGANNILLDIAMDKINPDNLKMEANSILEQTDYLSKTIDDFRNFFKPDNEKEEIFLKDVVDDTMKIINKSLENNNIILNINYEDTGLLYLYSRELLQVLLNIIKNAKEALVEYTNKDREISIFTYDEHNYVVIKICNNGGNIDVNHISKIFDPYFTTKDEKTGTGIGLYMSKTIVEKHLHGYIHVENTTDGVCFEIKIPKMDKEKD